MFPAFLAGRAWIITCLHHSHSAWLSRYRPCGQQQQQQSGHFRKYWTSDKAILIVNSARWMIEHARFIADEAHVPADNTTECRLAFLMMIILATTVPCQRFHHLEHRVEHHQPRWEDTIDQTHQETPARQSHLSGTAYNISIPTPGRHPRRALRLPGSWRHSTDT